MVSEGTPIQLDRRVQVGAQEGQGGRLDRGHVEASADHVVDRGRRCGVIKAGL